jgi:hypothetical protein
MVPQGTQKMGYFPSQGASQEDYKTYGWLFGGK